MLRRRTFAASLIAAPLAMPSVVRSQPAWPDRPVRLIVPFGAGGATDVVARALSETMSTLLGQSVVIVNQGGASGSVGTKSVVSAPKDGYTWGSGAAKDVGVYAVSGLLDTKLDDWHLYLAVINSAVVGVNAKTPYKTLNDLVAAMKANPDKVTVATAGAASVGSPSGQSSTARR